MTAADRAKAAEVTAWLDYAAPGDDRDGLELRIAAALSAARADAAADRDRAWRTAVDGLAEEWEREAAEHRRRATAYREGEFSLTAGLVDGRADLFADAAARLRGLDPTSSEEE